MLTAIPFFFLVTLKMMVADNIKKDVEAAMAVRIVMKTVSRVSIVDVSSVVDEEVTVVIDAVVSSASKMHPSLKVTLTLSLRMPASVRMIWQMK